MPSVTIDAGVLAVPPPDSSVADAHSYVETVIAWCSLIDCPWVEIYMTENVCEALVYDQFFPFFPHLKSLFADNGIEHYDANTVNIAVGRLLNQSITSFEEYFRIREVLSEEPSVSPDVLHQSRGDALRSDLSRCLLLTAILRKYCREDFHSHALILRHAPSPVLTVRAMIEDLEHNRNDLDELSISPDVFEGEVLICDDPKGMIKCMDGATILASSEDNVGVDSAIRIALFKSRIERGKEAKLDELPKFRIGEYFLGTVLQACHAESALPEKILRSIVETLEGLNLADVHPLRTGLGANDPRQKRGKDTAMRRDIDPIYHLHYWSCDDGLVEFATVSYPHDNFWIPN